MMRCLFFYGMFFTYFMSQAQKKPVIVNAYAFCTERSPGNIPVDDNGKPMYTGPDTLYTVYLETSGPQIHWDFAWVDHTAYKVHANLVSATTLEIGFKKNGSEKIVLKFSAKNVVWRLQLAVDDGRILALSKKIKPHTILLRGKYSNKTIFQEVNHAVMLSLPPAE